MTRISLSGIWERLHYGRMRKATLTGNFRIRCVTSKHGQVYCSTPSEFHNEESNPSTSGLKKFVSKTDVLKAEVMWTIQTIVNHNSYKSNETVGPLFKAIFPDSVRLLKSSHVANARLHISLCLGLLSILDP